MNIVFMFLYIFLYHALRVGRGGDYENIYNILTVVVLVVSVFGTLFLSESDMIDILVGTKEGDVSCVRDRSNPNDKGVTALPVSYSDRGVQVFTGEYNSNSKKWKNGGENGIHREYLQFEKGYKITSGACNSGSNTSSVRPPQGQQLS